jgi:hypothetical protein
MYMTFCLKGFFGYQVLDSGEIYWFENFHQATEPDLRELDALPGDRWQQKLLDLHRQTPGRSRTSSAPRGRDRPAPDLRNAGPGRRRRTPGRAPRWP